MASAAGAGLLADRRPNYSRYIAFWRILRRAYYDDRSIYSAELLALDFIFGALLIAPILLFLAPFLTIYLVRSAQGRHFLPSVAVYAASGACLVSQYLWLRLLSSR